MPTIQFETKLYKIGTWTILHLPIEASAKLPSRGMTMVSGTMNGVSFKTLLEPDGHYARNRKPSHWFRVDEALFKNGKEKAGQPALAMLKALRAGDTASITLESTKQWVEPEVPEDMKRALASSPKAKALWGDITPIARWDWVRWVRAVKTPETREKHIEVMLDKLNKGMRRPCCFNRAMCSEPYVSKNWQLLTPTQ